MNLQHYLEIIENAKSENRSKGDGVYYENHHITPKKMGGSDDDCNMVLLTGEEHFKVHTLLPYFTTGADRESMINAWWSMCHKNGHSINFEEYAFLKQQHAEITSKRMSKHNKGKVGVRNSLGETFQVLVTDPRLLSGELVHTNTGSKHSDKTIQKMKDAWTDERRQAQSQAQLGRDNPNYGGKTQNSKKQKETWANKTQEELDNFSKTLVTNWQKRKEVTCPHCGMISKNIGNMNRWHFDNCKQKGNK